MGMTMTQKILAAHAGLDSVVPGQLIEANIDLALANDITGPVAIRELKKADMDKVSAAWTCPCRSGPPRRFSRRDKTTA